MIFPTMALPPCVTSCSSFTSPPGNFPAISINAAPNMFLGVPFDVPSYALLTCMIAHVKAATSLHSFGDAQVYLNHNECRQQVFNSGVSLVPFPRSRSIPRCATSSRFRVANTGRSARIRSAPFHQGAHRRMTVSCIVAVSENGVIGARGDLPWRLQAEVRDFKAKAIGRAR